MKVSDHAAPTTLSVVEHRVGRDLNHDVIASFRDEDEDVPGAVSRDRDEILGLARALDELRHVIEMALASRRFGYTPQNKPSDWPSHVRGLELYLDPGLAMHSAEAGVVAATGLGHHLQHMLLYTSRVLVLDDTFSWARSVLIDVEAYGEDVDLDLPRLRAALTRLLLHAAALRTGDVLTAPPVDTLRLHGQEAALLFDPAHQAVLWHEPRLAHALAQTRLLPDWDLRSQGFDPEDRTHFADIAHYVLQEVCSQHGDLDPRRVEVVWQRIRTSIWPNVAEDAVREVLAAAHVVREAALTPVATDALLPQHLLASARLLEATPATADYSAAVSFGLPALSDVTLERLVLVRREQTFAAVQEALVEMTSTVRLLGTPNYAAYHAALVEAAGDLLTPVIEQLSKRLKREKALQLLTGGMVASGVALGIRSVAGVLLGPAGEQAAVGPAAGAGRALSRRLGQDRATTIENLKVLNSVCLSLAPRKPTPSDPYAHAP